MIKQALTRFSFLASIILSGATVTAAEPNKNDWLMSGSDHSNQRHSMLDQITTENVADLKAVGFFPASTKGARQQTTPVVIDGVIYFTVPNNQAVALDMNTGKTLWSYEYEIDWQKTALCCGTLNRGLAVQGDKVFLSALNATVIALDSKTGKELWKTPASDIDSEDGYSYTMAPQVVGNKVIVGSAGGEYGIRGFVDAYDIETGEKCWRFWTVPSPEEGGWFGNWVEKTERGDDLHRDIEKEKANKDKYPDAWKTGGGSVWTTPAYDAELELLYVGVGNPSPNLDDSVRPGDNLYTNSIVALDINTGELKWYYQVTPHDRWDYDVASPLVLHDVKVGDHKVAAVSHASKSGWLYTLDRKTGKVITRSENFVPQKNLFASPTIEGINIAPGARGGANWAAPSWSPKTDLFYLLALHLPMDFTLNPADRKSGVEWLGGEVIEKDDEKGYGIVSAISPETGKIIWEKKEKSWIWTGGILTTAGNVLFYPEPTGIVHALNAETGEELWTHETQVNIDGAPVTFMFKDKQFVLFTSTKGLHFFAFPDVITPEEAEAIEKQKMLEAESQGENVIDKNPETTNVEE